MIPHERGLKLRRGKLRSGEVFPCTERTKATIKAVDLRFGKWREKMGSCKPGMDVVHLSLEPKLDFNGDDMKPEMTRN